MLTCYLSVSSYELMKQCWADKPQSRPSFSSLVVSMGNMLSDGYKQVTNTWFILHPS